MIGGRIMIKFKKIILDKIRFLRSIDYKKKIRNNSLFVITVLSLLFNSTMLRFVTVKNYFEIRPLIADLAIILILCSLLI